VNHCLAIGAGSVWWSRRIRSARRR
jgi:hypothetical protein